ncbi:hypothetical protein TWF481_009782 [Arthrobotrys musiformis]|uniref:Tho complex subunit 7/Mft1p n=1 Tax=Arthrobotrys musiformis TaxID=47236 RepID=A0AAV9W4S9_9PEZI
MALVPQTPLFDERREFDEEALIKSRLITLEVKTLSRVQRRCNAVITAENTINDSLKSAKDDANVEMTDAPPANGGGGTVQSDATGTKPGLTHEDKVGAAAEKLAEEILLDFAPLEEALMRLQLLTAANRKEVARYEQKKMQIEQASQKARNEMVELNASLTEAQQLKQHKLEYDVIATEITSSPNSQKTRQAQYDSINRLNAEIDALERERADYGKVWAARRAQFGAIVEALMGMQAQIQEDKEEQERREGLDEDEEDGEKSAEGGDGKETKTEENASSQNPGQPGGAGAEGKGPETGTKEEGDVVMEDTQPEEGEHISTRDQSHATSPRVEDDGEIEEGEELEEGEEVGDEGSVAPTPAAHDVSFEEMETDDRPPDHDDDEMEDEGAIEEHHVNNSQEPRSQNA